MAPLSTKTPTPDLVKELFVPEMVPERVEELPALTSRLLKLEAAESIATAPEPAASFSADPALLLALVTA